MDIKINQSIVSLEMQPVQDPTSKSSCSRDNFSKAQLATDSIDDKKVNKSRTKEKVKGEKSKRYEEEGDNRDSRSKHKRRQKT